MSRTVLRGVAAVVAAATAVSLAACSDSNDAEGGAGDASSASSSSTASSASSASPSSSATQASGDCQIVVDDPAWYGDNRERINDMLDEYGACGGSGDDEGAPLALFDWDNTVVKNDIGEAQSHWMILNGKILQPEDGDWGNRSPWFTAEAVDALNAACRDLAEPGEPLPTDSAEGEDCAAEIAAVVDESETADGEEAFHDFNARRLEPAYAFAGQLMAGYTEDEIKEFAEATYEENTSAPEGTEIEVGGSEVPGWIRYYDQMTNLIDALRDHGFDVRIISASSEPVAEVWGEKIGFTPDKVMGMKMEVVDGTWTDELVGCGGDDGTMTYIEGKRCRVNEEVLGITGPEAFEVAPEDRRQVFAAGDSDTDVSFLADATGLKLVQNRNKVEVMCRAYDDADGNWLINPTFLDPADKEDDPYPCSTEGYIEPDGSTGPLIGDDGEPVADQEDTVHP